MNLDELRAELDRLAGPEVLATDDVRGAVRRRADRARHRFGAMAATATVVVGVLVAVLVGAALRGGDSSNVDVLTVPPTTAVGPACGAHLATVPAKDVPPDVAAWAQGAPVVGGGALWTVRSAIDVPAVSVRTPNAPRDVWLLKFPWLTRPSGLPTIAGRRLDGPGGFAFDVHRAIGGRGAFVTSSLTFTVPGCWEVNARFGGATISFRILVGNPPRPLAIGTIAGSLREVGGPSPGLNRPISGFVRIFNATSGWDGPTEGDGNFRVDLPAGTYTATGTSPAVGAGQYPCAAGGSVVVTPGRTTSVKVICSID
jgi:hypothetical protein